MEKKNEAVKVNKTQYVLAHAKLTAAELVAQAQKEKIALSEKYVYSIRSKVKTNKGVGSGKRGPKPGARARKTEASNGPAAESMIGNAVFVDAALSLGLDKAEALLGKLKAAVASVV